MNKKLDQYRQMDFQQLKSELKSLKKQLFVLRMQVNMGEENVKFHQIKPLRKTIAFLTSLISIKIKK